MAVQLFISMVTFRYILKEPSNPELVNRVLVVQSGAPCFGIHMCDCGGCNNDFLSWYDPISDIHVNSVRHPNDVKVHPEPQGLGVDGLENRQAEQLLGIKLDTAV